MNDLSNPAPSAQNAAAQADASGSPSDPNTPVSSVTPTGNKEVVGGGIHAPEGLRDATGREFAVPREVSGAGVRVHPTAIPIPPPVAQLGVKPGGMNIPTQTASTIVLPLSDDQIARGLHESITSSLRWLSEWCIRRLKQIHGAVRTAQEKPERAKQQ